MMILKKSSKEEFYIDGKDWKYFSKMEKVI